MMRRNINELEKHSRIYFTYADTETSLFYQSHERSIVIKARRLRRYFALYAILYDHIVVLDSSLFHNRILEHLCMKKSSSQSISPLLTEGFIIPALRTQCRDFKDLFDYFLPLRDGSLEWWGSHKYADYLNHHLLSVVSWDNTPQWAKFIELFTEAITEQNGAYFSQKKLPNKLLNQLLETITENLNQKGYVPRGAISKEYKKKEYDEYRTSIKFLSDHIYYIITSILIGTDCSFHSTLPQKKYLKRKFASCFDEDILNKILIFQEFDYRGPLMEHLKTFLLNPTFLEYRLNFEQLLNAKEKLRSAEYGHYLKLLTKVSKGNITPSTIEDLLESLYAYLRELEVLIIDHPRYGEYEKLKQEYINCSRWNKLVEYFIIAFSIAGSIFNIISEILTILGSILGLIISIATPYVGKYLKKREKRICTCKENLRNQISLSLRRKFVEFPVKVALDTILKKKNNNKDLQVK